MKTEKIKVKAEKMNAQRKDLKLGKVIVKIKNAFLRAKKQP